MLLRGTSDQYAGVPHCESSYLLQAFEETPTHMSIKINRLEEQCGKRPLANSPKASGNFRWRVRSTLYLPVW
jgi:hypothetical protein